MNWYHWISIRFNNNHCISFLQLTTFEIYVFSSNIGRPHCWHIPLKFTLPPWNFPLISPQKGRVGGILFLQKLNNPHLHSTQVFEESKQAKYSQKTSHKQEIEYMCACQEADIELSRRDDVNPRHGACEVSNDKNRFCREG